MMIPKFPAQKWLEIKRHSQNDLGYENVASLVVGARTCLGGKIDIDDTVVRQSTKSALFRH